MKLAGKKANEKNVPVVLDAVGVGATSYRNEVSRELLKEIQIDVLKGNASEIASIAGLETLSVLQQLEPGETAEHKEVWSIRMVPEFIPSRKT